MTIILAILPNLVCMHPNITFPHKCIFLVTTPTMPTKKERRREEKDREGAEQFQLGPELVWNRVGLPKMVWVRVGSGSEDCLI